MVNTLFVVHTVFWCARIAWYIPLQSTRLLESNLKAQGSPKGKRLYMSNL